MRKLLLILFFGALSISAQAEKLEGGDFGPGNGGDEVAFDFARMAYLAAADTKNYPELKNLDLAKLLREAEIYVSNDPIYVMKGQIRQESVAKNTRDPNRIVISRARWLKIAKEQTKKAVALHELLGLAGLEGTGNYRISQRYLRELGVHCGRELCAIPVRYDFWANDSYTAGGECYQSVFHLAQIDEMLYVTSTSGRFQEAVKIGSATQGRFEELRDREWGTVKEVKVKLGQHTLVVTGESCGSLQCDSVKLIPNKGGEEFEFSQPIHGLTKIGCD